MQTSAGMGLTLSIDDGVATIVFDQSDSPINTLNSRLASAFTSILDHIEADNAITSVVLWSGKLDSWIAGADIAELQSIRSSSQGEELSRTAHRLFARVESLGKPIVAAIHGAALGGGLELALACSWRIASDHEKTVLALPEVKLGLVPGGGGTQRLPRLIGVRAALDMMLTGKNVRSSKALQTGLVNEVVHPSVLYDVACRRAKELAKKRDVNGRNGRKRRSFLSRLPDDSSVGRALVFYQAKHAVRRKTRKHYPAPYAIIDAVKVGYAAGIEAGYSEEVKRFGELTVSEVTRELLYLFFATSALKKDNGVPSGASGAKPVSHLGVVGAGFMGSGIAALAIQRDTMVRLKDTTPESVARGYRSVQELVNARLKRKSITAYERDLIMARLSPATDYVGFESAELIVEAVFEDIAVKHDVLREVELHASNAVFATNTSTIPIAEIARVAERPGRVVGMHFFSPVHKMPLLEVIAAPDSDSSAIITAVEYGKRLGKTVIVVKDGPGFYVNRILAPYINESGRLLDEGADIIAVDDALVEFGFPVGPLTLLDEVGLDVAAKSGRNLSERLGDRFRPAETLLRVIESGRKGRKTRRGFYRYDERGSRLAPDTAVYDLTPVKGSRKIYESGEIYMRAVLPMLNEAVACLDEGIISSPRDGDVGAVFGVGFPPFLGGPFRYIDKLGADEVVRRMDELAARYPKRFEVTPLLRTMAAEGTRFHADTEYNPTNDGSNA